MRIDRVLIASLIALPGAAAPPTRPPSAPDVQPVLPPQRSPCAHARPWQPDTGLFARQDVRSTPRGLTAPSGAQASSPSCMACGVAGRFEVK